MTREGHVRFCKGLKVKLLRSTYLCQAREMKYEFIRLQKTYPVTKWAAMLGVSTSGYYDWLRFKDERDKKATEYENAVKEAFGDGEGTYGVCRICGCLRNRGYTASYQRVKAIMNQLGLVSIHRRRRQRSLTDSRTSKGLELPNLFKGLEVARPFEVLCSDITYIRTGEGFEYLCTIKDVASRAVLAETMRDNMKADLVADTIKKAYSRWGLATGVIFHSDRGSQYTSAVVRKVLADRGARQSFSRVGKPGDNAHSESHFANLKKEAVHWCTFRTREMARQAIFAYTESFYNTRRVQKCLGYLSPLQWLKRYCAGELGAVA